MIKQSVLNANGTVTMLIEKSDKSVVARDFWVRAAIVWPMAHGRSVTGAFLIGLWDIRNERLLIDYERKFVSVDHVITAGVLSHTGLSTDLQKMWGTYKCRKIYYSGNEDEHDRHRIMVSRSKQIDPKPVFVRVTLDVGAVRRWQQLDRFRVQRGTMLWDDLSQFESNDQSEPSPLILALNTLIAGAEEYPYRHDRQVVT